MRILIDADACPVVRITEQVAKKARNAKKKHHLKGPAKRTAEDDQRFEDSLRKLLDFIKSEWRASQNMTNS